MRREFPLTENQLKLFQSARAEADAKVAAIDAELAKTITLIGSGIVAGRDDLPENVSVSINGWGTDPPRLIVTTDEPEPAPDSAAEKTPEQSTSVTDNA